MLYIVEVLRWQNKRFRAFPDFRMKTSGCVHISYTSIFQPGGKRFGPLKRVSDPRGDLGVSPRWVKIEVGQIFKCSISIERARSSEYFLYKNLAFKMNQGQNIR